MSPIRNLCLLICLVVGLGLAWAVPALAGAEEEQAGAKSSKGKALKLEEITVKGENLHRDDLATTVNVLSAEDFEGHYATRVEEMLEQVPGVTINGLNKGGVVNNIKMRGFTSGGHGGDVGLFVDGIPLNEGESHSDGYCDMNVLIPLEIDRLEVFKGPSSALYGNFGRGGVLAFTTKHSGEYNKMKLEYGSYNTVDVQGAFGQKMTEQLQNNTALQVFRTDDYREHSDWIRLNASTRFSYKVSDKLDLGLALRVHSSSWDGSNNISQAMFDDDNRRNGFPDYCQDDGGDKKFFSEKVDLGYNISPEMRLLYWVYSVQQDFTRFQTSGTSPYGQKEYYYDRLVFGTGVNLNLDTKVAGHSLSGVVGAEVYDERTDTDVYNTTNRQRDSHLQNRTFDIVTYSLFAQSEYELSQYFRPMLGLRFDTFGGSLDNDDPGITPYSSDINDFNKLSPKIGFRSMLVDKLDFRASYCEGFALPKSAAKFDSAIHVDPVDLRQYEVGLNYQISGLLWADVAAFILDSDGEVLEDPVGSGVYHNAGETRRQGVEAGFRVYPLPGVEIFGNITFLDTEIKDNPDPSLVGKELTSNPEFTSNLGVSYTAPDGWGGRVKWHKEGESNVDSANKYTYDGYDRVDVDLFYTFKGEKGRKYRLTFSVDNILDEAYADSVSYSGGELTYSPAWPRAYWLSLTLDW